MRRILKLTPEKIKQIIEEEREALRQEKKQKLLEHLKLLKKIKEQQKKSLKEVSQLHDVKMLLIKKIKGEK